MTPSVTTPSSTVLERATALVPQLRESALATEQARRVLPETFEALSRAGVFRMTAPKKYGGEEVDFQTQCDVLAEIARGCPSTSWVATIFSAMSWLAGTLPGRSAGGDLRRRRPAHQRRVLPHRHRRAEGRRLRRQRTLGIQHRRPGLALDGARHHPHGGRRPAALRARAHRRPRLAGRLERHRHGGHRQPHGRGQRCVRARLPGGAAARSRRRQGRGEPAHREQSLLQPAARRRCSSSTAAARRSAPRAAPTRRSWNACPAGRSRTRTTPTAPRRR